MEKPMLTRRIILEQLDAYLNGRVTLAALVDWAEMMLIEPDIAADEDAEALMNVLTYLGAADSHGFPLTWDMLISFVEQLGGRLTAELTV